MLSHWLKSTQHCAIFFLFLFTCVISQCPNGPTSLSITTQPGNAAGGQPLQVQPIVTLRGIEGQPCYGDNTTVVFASLQVNPAVFAVLRIQNEQSIVSNGNGPRATATNGTVTFEGMYVNENATGYTILFVASQYGLFVESATFSITVGKPDHLILHRDHTSGVLWAGIATGTRGGTFTITGTGGLPINPPPRVSLVDMGGNVVIDPQYSRGVAAEVSIKTWPTSQKYLNYTNSVWTLTVNSAGITEPLGAVVTQGSVTGTLSKALVNTWTVAINSAGITESQGVVVTQGSSTGVLVTQLQNVWTFTFSNDISIMELQNVAVTQLAPTAVWTIGISSIIINELQDVTVNQGLQWTFVVTDLAITETAGVSVVQGSSNGVLSVSTENEWTVTLNNAAKITEAATASVTQGSSSGTLVPNLVSLWTMGIVSEVPVTELQGTSVTQGLKWTLTVDNLGITELQDTVITQGSATGTLVSSLYNTWTFNINAQSISEYRNVAVTQGSSSGTLNVVGDNIWTVNMNQAIVIGEAQGVPVNQRYIWTMTLNSAEINENAGVVVTQVSRAGAGHNAAGTLTVSCSGPTTTIIILAEPGTIFDSSANLVIGTTTINALDVIGAISSWGASGTLRIGLSAATSEIIPITSTTIEINSELGVIFDSSNSLVVGSTVVQANILTNVENWALENIWTMTIVNTAIEELAGAAVTQGSSSGKLKVLLTGASTTSVVITAVSGVTFDALTDLVIGSTTVPDGDISGATNTGATTSVVINALSGVSFDAVTNLNVGTTLITGGDIVGAVHTGVTTSIEIAADPGTVFDISTNLDIGGSTTILASDVTNAVSSWGSSGTLSTSLASTWTIATNNLPVSELQGVTITQGSSTGILVNALENNWNATIASSTITELQGVVVKQGLKWTITTNSVGIEESAGVVVTQGSASGLLHTTLENVWTIGMSPSAVINENMGSSVTQGLKWAINIQSQGITEAQGVVVTQGTSSGLLATALENSWTLNILSAGITETQGVIVSQGSFKGTLKTALSNSWTLTINAQTINELQGVTVVQGSSTGTLSVALTGADMTTIVIDAASSVVFDITAPVEINGGTTTILTSNVINSVHTGATTSIVIDTQSHVPFDANTDLLVGTTTILATNLVSAANTGKTTAVVISALPGVTFDTSLDLVIGGAVAHSIVYTKNLISAAYHWDSTGTLRRTYTDVRASIEIVVLSGVEFNNAVHLVVGSTIVPASQLNTAVNSGGTTSIVIAATSSVIFDFTTELVVGSTVVPAPILTNAVASWDSTGTLKTALTGSDMKEVLITAASGITFDTARNLVIGSTTVLASNVYTTNNDGATTSIHISAASNVVFDSLVDLTVGSTIVLASDLIVASNTGGTTSVVIIAESEAIFTTTLPLVIGSTILASNKLATAVHSGATTSFIIKAASGVTFDAAADIVIGSTTVLVANLNTALNTGATTQLVIIAEPETTFDASTDLQVGSTSVLHGSVTSATSEWLATGTLVTELSGGVVSISIAAANGVVFDTTNSMIIGSTVVSGSIISTATKVQSTFNGILTSTMNGLSASVSISTLSDISFHTLTDLIVGSTTITAASLASIAQTGATTSVVISAVSSVVFDTTSDLVIGSKTISAVDVTGALNTGATTQIEITVEHGLMLDSVTNLIVGGTTVLGSAITDSSSTEYDGVVTNHVDTRIGLLSSTVGTSSNLIQTFNAGTATFIGLKIDVAGSDYLLEFAVSNLSYAFPDYVATPYRVEGCSQSLLTTQSECIATNTWNSVVLAHCLIPTLTEYACSLAGSTWIPTVNASCTQPLLTILGQGNCTAVNTWDAGESLKIGNVFEEPILYHNLTFNVTAHIGVGPANNTLVKYFPYGSVLGGEAIFPTTEVWLVDAGLNLISSDSVSRCTASLYSTPYHGREEHPGYGVARIGTELLPSLDFSHSFLENKLFNQGDNQSLTVDFKQGVASFTGLNVSHIGGPYVIEFNATAQKDPRSSPNDWVGSVTGYTSPFYVAEGKPRRLEVLRRPFADIAGRTPFQPQPTVALVDAGGNTIRSENNHYVTAELYSTTHPDGVEAMVLLGKTTIKFEAGIAQFEDLALEDAAVEYMIKFTTTATYVTPRYAPIDAEPLSVKISVACRYSAVKTITSEDPQPRDGFGYAVDTEVNYDTDGVANGRMLMVSGSPFEDRPISEIQTVRTKAESISYVSEVQTITTSVLHIPEIQQIITSVSPNNAIKTTIVQTGDRIDLVPTFRLRWKYNSYLSDFIVFEDPPHKPITETVDIPWNILPSALATILMRDFAELGIGNVDVTRESNSQACSCSGSFKWLVTFRDIHGPVPILTAYDSGFSVYAPGATIITSRVQESPSVSGFFTLSFPHLIHTGHIGPIQGPLTSRNIPFNTSAEMMRTIIQEDLWSYTSVDVQVVGLLEVPILYLAGASKFNVVDFSRKWTLTFGSEEMYYEVPQLLPTSTGLSGHGARAVVATYVQGAAPVGGHFSLGFRGNGNVGKMLRWNATSNDVKEALENLNSIYKVDVIRSEPMGADRSYEWTITFNRVSNDARPRKERHSQTDLNSPMWADDQDQEYSWNDWIDTNGNLRPLDVNQSYTSGSDVSVQVGAVYDMTTLVEPNHMDIPSYGTSMRNQILNNIGNSMKSGTYKNFGGAAKKSARMGHYGNDAGAAYIFTRNESQHRWSQRIKLQSIDTTATDQFGHSVSASGTAVLIGAPGANDDGLVEQKAFRCVADGGNFRLVFRSKGQGQSVTSKQYTRTTNQGPAPNLEVQPEEGYAEENAPTKSFTKALWAGTLTIKEMADALSEAWSVGRVVIRRRYPNNVASGTTVDTAFEAQMLNDPKTSSLNRNMTENSNFLNTKVCSNGNLAEGYVDLVIFFHSRTGGYLPTIVAEPSPMHMFPLIVNGTAEQAKIHVADLVHGTPERRNVGAAHVFRWDRRASKGLTSSDVWYEEAKLMIPTAMSNTGNQFGYQVELEGGTAIVSAPGDQHRGPDSGAVYIFKRIVPFEDSSNSIPLPGEAISSRRRIAQAIDAPEWIFSQRLTAQDFSCGLNSDTLRPVDCSPTDKLHTGRRFGSSMQHFQGTIVIAERPLDSRWGSSRVLVYRRLVETSIFQPSQVILDPFVPPSGTALSPITLTSMFGFSMAIDKDTLAIGAPGLGTPNRKGVVLLYKRAEGELNFPLVYESRVEAGYGSQEGDGFGSQVVLDICSEAEANPETTEGNDILIVASHAQGISLPELRPRKLVQSIVTQSTDNGTLSGYFYVTRSYRRRTTVKSELDTTLSGNFDIIKVGSIVEVRRQGNAGIRYFAARVIFAPNYRPDHRNTGNPSDIVDDTYIVRYDKTGVRETGVRRQRIRRPSTFTTSTSRTHTEEFAPIHTRRVAHDVSAAELSVIFAEDLGMYGARIQRWGPDPNQGYIWVVTHQREYGENPVLLGARTSGALVSSIGGKITQVGTSYGRSNGGTKIVVKTLSKPARMYRRSINVFFRDRKKFMLEGSNTWIKHGVMRPISEEGRYETKGTDLMGASPVNSMSMASGVIIVGAPNMDSYFSGNNAGAVQVFDLSYFNLAFENPSSGFHTVNEDDGHITINVRRCHHGAGYCRIKSLQNSDPRTMLQYAEYIVGDGAGSRVPGAIEQKTDLLDHPSRDYAGEVCPNPNGGCASTATGRAECLYRTRFGKAVNDCLWIPGSSKIYQPSSFDFSATSDYVPDWQVFTMDPNNGTALLFQFDVIITNDRIREFPDERLNMRMVVPGIEPTWGGNQWTTLEIKDDGDGGVGLSSYYETLSASEPEPLRNQSETKCVGSPIHIISHVSSTLARSAECKSLTSHVLCHEVPGCSWFEGATPGKLNETNLNGPLPSEFANKEKNASRFNEFGSTVVIDRVLGNIAVVSAPETDIGGHRETGAVYVYHKRSSHGVWERVKVLHAPDPWFRSGTHFGRSLAISNGTLVVGADHHYPNERGTEAATNSHRAYVYKLQDSAAQRTGTLWKHEANLTWPLDHVFSDASGTRFGAKHGVAVSGDWVAIGASGDESVFLFQRCYDCGITVTWDSRQRLRRPNHNEVLLNGRDLDSSAEATMHQRYLARADYGASVAMWNDTLLVGCPDDEYELTDTLDEPVDIDEEIKVRENKAFYGRGSVYVYLIRPQKALIKSNTSWELQTTLRAPDASQRDRFGESIDINWDYVVVGSPADAMKPRTTWDFETGNLVGWHKTGTAFDFQPTIGDNSNGRAVYGRFASAGTDVHETKEEMLTSVLHDPQIEENLVYLRRDYINQHAYRGNRGQESNKQLKYWIGTYENRTHLNISMGMAQGDVPQGTLTSDPFTVGGSSISFLIGGGCEKDDVRVELLIDGEQFVFPHADAPFLPDNADDLRTLKVLIATGDCTESMQRVVWDVSMWIGRTAQFRIVDASSRKWGHINIDDIRFDWGSTTDGPHHGVSGDGNITCSKGQCGDQMGHNAGAAYLWRRVRNSTVVVDMGAGRVERERCEQYCNSHGCFLVDVPGQFAGQRASPFYTGDAHSHRYSAEINRWNCEWDFVTKLLASDRRPGDKFGTDVSVNGYSGIVVVGAPGSRTVDHLNRDFVDMERKGHLIPGYGYVSHKSGAIYVFAMDEELRSSQGYLLKGQSWNATEHTKLQPPQKINNGNFGASVAVDESYHTLTGAPSSPSSFEAYSPEAGLSYSYDIEFLNLKFITTYVSVMESIYYQGEHRYDFSENFVEIELTRTGALQRPLSVAYATSDITAIGISAAAADLCFSYSSDHRGQCGDYVQTAGTVTFDSGVSLVHIRVYIMEDFCPEATEYFRLQLSVPGGDVILGSDYSVTVEINDDDNVKRSKSPLLSHFSDGTDSSLNCGRRVVERTDRDLPFLHRVEEREEVLRPSIGSKMASKQYMASDRRGFYNDGSVRDE